MSSNSSSTSLDLDFNLSSPLSPFTSTRNYSRKCSIWSMNSEIFSQSYDIANSGFSVGSSDISGLNWICPSTCSTSFRPLLTNISKCSSSNVSSHKFCKPSSTSLDEDVFKNDTLSFNGGYYTLTTVNHQDMLSCSYNILDACSTTSTDSAISSGCAITKVTDDFNAYVNTYPCGGTPIPLGKINYDKPSGPSQYGMRRRRMFTFGTANWNKSYYMMTTNI